MPPPNPPPRPFQYVSDKEWVVRVAKAMALSEGFDWKNLSEAGKERFLDIAKYEEQPSIKQTKWMVNVKWVPYYHALFPPKLAPCRIKMARKTAR